MAKIAIFFYHESDRFGERARHEELFVIPFPLIVHETATRGVVFSRPLYRPVAHVKVGNVEAL